MNKSRLKLYTMLRLHRGEEAKFFTFILLNLLLSLVLGIISSAVDPLFLLHVPDSLEMNVIRLFSWSEVLTGRDPNSDLAMILLGVTAFLLIIAGSLYSRFLERFNKTRVFVFAVFFLAAVPAAGFFLIWLDRNLGRIPFLYSGLYIFRFFAGIMGLMLFWDMVYTYFDSRQVKRLFPMLFSSGAAGYGIGGLFVIPFSQFHFTTGSLLFAAAVSLLLLVMTTRLPHRFNAQETRLFELRTRRHGQFIPELKENPFVQALALSTIVFGILGGFIMFTYNRIVISRLTTAAGTSSFMAVQRAAATAVQAVVIGRLLSPTYLGARIRKNIIIQGLFLLLGFIAFVISFVGTADFTRQIAVALMSPALLASLTIIPLRRRGAVLAFNNLVIAPAGMLLTSCIVFLIFRTSGVTVYIITIFILILIRMVLNLLINDSYFRFMRKKLYRSDSPGLVYSNEFLKNPHSVEALMQKIADADEEVRYFVWQRIASAAPDPPIQAVLKKYKPPSHSILASLWVRLLGSFDFEANKNEIAELKKSSDSETAFLASYYFIKYSPPAEYRRWKHQVSKNILAIIKTRQRNLYKRLLAWVRVFSMLEDDDYLVILETYWDTAEPLLRNNLFQLFSQYPRAGQLPLYYKELELGINPFVLDEIAKRHDVGFSFLKKLYDANEDPFIRIKVLIVAGNQQPERCVEFLLEEFYGLAGRFYRPSETTLHLFIHSLPLWSQRYAELFCTAGRSLLLLPFEPPLTLVSMTHDLSLFLFRVICAVFYTLIAAKRESSDPYIVLIEKWMTEEIEKILKTLFILSGFKIKNGERRKVVAETADIFSIHSPETAETVLDILEYTDAKTAGFFGIFLEPLTEEEQLSRMDKYIDDFSLSLHEIMINWKDSFPAETSAAKRGLVTHYLSTYN